MLKKLDFNSAISSTISDANGEGTGFNFVLTNSDGTQYAPNLVNLYTTAGTLALTGTQGTNIGTTNTLKNALALGIDASQTFTVSASLKNPFKNLNTPYQQGGIFLGSSQDNYVKVVAVNTLDGPSIQFFREENGVGSSLGEIKGLNWANIKSLDLTLTGNPLANTISASYRVNSNTTTSFTQKFKPSQSATSASFFANAATSRAGILAFTKAADNAPVAFESFSIDQKSIKINFQTSTAFVPAGYIKDIGEGYDAARGYGWVTQTSLQSATHKPLDITPYARNRDRSTIIDQRIDTLLHMQASTPDAAWEYAVANGTYSVTVSVGDGPNYLGVYDSKHTIRVEGVKAINQFQSNSVQEYQLATVKVNVKDGRLTVDAIGGSNTKINYLEIQQITAGSHPNVTSSSITGDDDNKPGIFRDAAINLDVFLPNTGKGVNEETLNTTNVQLYRTFDKAPVFGNVNTSGGGDAIVYQPTVLLDPNTNYTFKVTNGVTDEAGASFIPYSTTFNTGIDTSLPLTPGAESIIKSTVYGGDGTGGPLSSLLISPDGNKLYATGLDGRLRRWTINSDGTLSQQEFFTDSKLTNRAIIGIAFDPKNANVLWISHNAPLPFPDPVTGVTPTTKDFTGKISKVTLSDSGFRNSTIQDYVVNLPRSAKDHLTNSLAFGPDGKLYLSQGSNSAMGAPDTAWGNRSEHLLSGAILQIDTTRKAPAGGFNVQTENYEGKIGNYNPFAANAVVKLYGTGIRNAYDLVWHSNGYLYAPSNGSAAGGNTPEDPTQPGNQALKDVGTQHDYLFKIQKGGYYGHPNPKRGEYIMNGGNPTSGVDRNPFTLDPNEVVSETTDTGKVYAGYSVGVDPDPSYKGFAYDFGRNRSPNGAIEYENSTAFGGTLQGKLLVVEYSGGDDILALDPNANGNIPSGNVSRVSFGLTDPLDLVENTKNGSLYVAELLDGGASGGRITLLQPTA